MEILKDKKILVGGLAVLGAIALLAYLRPKHKMNSEGFFNANASDTNEKDTSNQTVPLPFIRKIVSSNNIPEYYSFNYVKGRYLKTLLIRENFNLAGFSFSPTFQFINSTEFYNAYHNKCNC